MGRGLLQVLRVLRLWQGHGLRAQGAALLARYARAAAWLFAAVTVTGTLSTLRRMAPHTVLEQLTTTGYGRTLLAKLLLLAVVAVLALRARRRAVACATRERCSPRAARRWRCSAWWWRCRRCSPPCPYRSAGEPSGVHRLRLSSGTAPAPGVPAARSTPVTSRYCAAR
ncbi:CopD family protein [Actinomadura keratinilytica]